MTRAAAVVACVALGYLSGSLPFGLWIGRVFRGVDVRTLGSKNLGATNVFRSMGRSLGLTTLALDVLKGTIPVWWVRHQGIAAAFPGGREVAALAVGLACIVRHVWTFLAGFKGGKAVATTAGVLLALSPLAFLAFGLVFVATVAVTRFISLGSMLGAVAFVVSLVWLVPGGAHSLTFAFGVVAALLVIVRHRDNIRRLLAGTQRRFEWRGGDGA